MALTVAWADRLGAGVISAVMSGVMSAVMIAINVGLGPDYPGAWLRSWALGFLVSFPAARLIVPPVVRWQQQFARRSAASASTENES